MRGYFAKPVEQAFPEAGNIFGVAVRQGGAEWRATSDRLEKLADPFFLQTTLAYNALSRRSNYGQFVSILKTL